MIITNKYGAPKPLVTLASKEYYSKGAAQYSATELMSSPRIQRLREQFEKETTSDVSEMLWSLMGSALHVVMDRSETPGCVLEERIFCSLGGTTISGAIDVQQIEENGTTTIIDYKFTSAWSVMNAKVEWEQQLNIYKYLVETVKHQPVGALKICSFIRDFNRNDVRDGYPLAPIHMVDIPMWPNAKTEQFLLDRIRVHSESKVHMDFDGMLPDCTDAERWMRETTYAAKKKDGKRAIKVFTNLAEATEFTQEKGYDLETRPGEPVRCTGNYCGVAGKCDQFQAEVAAGLYTPAAGAGE